MDLSFFPNLTGKSAQAFAKARILEGSWIGDLLRAYGAVAGPAQAAEYELLHGQKPRTQAKPPEATAGDERYFVPMPSEFEQQLLELGLDPTNLTMAGAAAKPLKAGAAAVGRSKARVATSGQYVGGPPGVDSPAALGAIVKKYVDNVQKGLPGAEFYNESSADFFKRVGGDVSEADRLAQNLAILSRSNSVGGNTNMSVKAAVQGATGTPVHTGRFPSRDSPQLQELYSETPQMYYAGHKREPFAEQLAVRWDPSRIGRGVNDMHEAETMGYPSGAVGGPTQHAFMDDVRERAIRLLNERAIGGRTDWNTGTAQAANWTGNKINRGDVSPGDAAKTYADYIPRFEANATYERTPGAGTGHLPGLLGAPFDARQAFHDNPLGNWIGPHGNDVGYVAARLLPGDTVPGVGRFRDEVNPASIARPLVAIDNLPGGQAIPQYSQDALNAVEAARAYMDVQNAGAWHKVLESKAPGYGAAGLRLTGGATPEAMMDLARIAEPKGYWLASAPDGATILANDATPRGPAFAADVRNMVKGGVKIDGTPEMGSLTSGYIDYSELWPQGRGAVTRRMLEEVDRSPKVRDALEASPEYRAAVLAKNDADLAAQAAGYGAPREDVLLARRIFAERGWAGLREAAAKGLVPAAAIAALGLRPEDSGVR